MRGYAPIEWWNERGYLVRPGERHCRRGTRGEALFHRSQVYQHKPMVRVIILSGVFPNSEGYLSCR